MIGSITSIADWMCTSLTRLCVRAEESIRRHERSHLALVLAIFALLAALQACTTLIWFDEFFTLFISRLPSLHEMLRAAPADGQPPLQYLPTYFSLRLFGQTGFALRLPEILACAAAGLLTWKIVRRHGTAVQALFAAALLLGSEIVLDQAHTARPYCLLLAFTCLAFACWQAAALQAHGRAWPLCGLALAIAGAVLSHHFGVFHTGIFLVAGETSRLIRRRRLDLWMAAAVAAGFAPLAFTVPLARGFGRALGQAILHSPNFWSRPSPIHLVNYLGMVALPLLCLVPLFAVLPWPVSKTPAGSSPLVPVPSHEWIAAGALSLLLPAILLFTTFATGYFLPRYAIGCALGLALLVAWALPRIPRMRSFAQPVLALSTLGFLVMVAAFLVGTQISYLAGNGQQRADPISPFLLRAPADLPIVVTNAYDYVPDWWYAPAPLQRRLVYLSDVRYAILQPDFVPELSLVVDRKFIPLPLYDYNSYIAAHPHFLLLRSGEARLNWTGARLASSGWRLTPLATAGAAVLYRVDRP